MSRPIILLVLVVLAVIGAAIGLSRVNTEVAPTRVEKPVANEALAR
jgi:hypothetical protein